MGLRYPGAYSSATTEAGRRDLSPFPALSQSSDWRELVRSDGQGTGLQLYIWLAFKCAGEGFRKPLVLLRVSSCAHLFSCTFFV